jgi:hypothetical protein
MSAETWAVSGDMMARDVELTATLVKLGRTRRMFGVEIAGTASGALDFDRSLDVGGDAQVSDVPGEASLDASLSTSITFSKPACGGAQAAACAARVDSFNVTAVGTAGGASRHVIKRILNPRFLSGNAILQRGEHYPTVPTPRTSASPSPAPPMARPPCWMPSSLSSTPIRAPQAW